MTSTTRKPVRSDHLFTVEKANSALPLVRAIVGDLAELSREVIERRRRLRDLMAEHKTEKRDLYGEELAQSEQELHKDTRRLQEYEDELRQLGVEFSGGSEGVVDFPAVLEGRNVFLCWKLGEPEVRHWHEPGATHAQRKPLAMRTGGGHGVRASRANSHLA